MKNDIIKTLISSIMQDSFRISYEPNDSRGDKRGRIGI